MPFPIAIPDSVQNVLVGAMILLVALIVLWFLLRPDKLNKSRSKKKDQESLFARVKQMWQRSMDKGARVAKKYKRERSGEWGRVQDEHLLREPACRACGYKGKKVQVHHIKPFHLYPDLELDPNNLITLCQARGKYHHMLLGHLNYWSSYNEEIEEDVKRFYGMSAKQIKASIEWKKKVALRPEKLKKAR